MITTIVAIVLFTLKSLIIGGAIGTVFVKLRLFPLLKDEHTYLIGLASVPMFLSLADYLLGLIFVGWSSFFYIFVPAIISIMILCVPNNFKLLFSLQKKLVSGIKYRLFMLRKWLFLDLYFALTVIFLYTVYVKINYKNLCDQYLFPFWKTLNFSGHFMIWAIGGAVIASVFIQILQINQEGLFKQNFCVVVTLLMIGLGLSFGISHNGRPESDTDRAHYQLNARYFCEDKNSWDIDDYKDERYGSSLKDDHGPLWTVYLSDAQIQANALGMTDPIRLSNYSVAVVYFCFEILLFICAYYLSGNYLSGVVALLLFGLYRDEIRMIFGSREAFRFIGLLLLILYISNNIFEIIENRAKWFHYLFLALFCFLSMNGHEGNAFIMLGMFIVFAFVPVVYKAKMRNIFLAGLSVFVGTLLGCLKTISIYLETGRISSSTITAFHDTPVVQQVKELNTSDSDWGTILSTYTKPVLFMIAIGIIGLVMVIAISYVKKDRKTLVCSLAIAGALLPMTGVLNWIGYDFSRLTAQQTRYRMYFLMLFSVLGAWLLTRQWKKRAFAYISNLIIVCMLILYLSSWYNKVSLYNYENYELPFAKKAYNFGKLADQLESLTDGDVFTNNQILVYYLHGNPKLLFHVYTEELIQAKTDAEIEQAMNNLNVGAIVLPESGLDYHDYSLLPFWKYINYDDSFLKYKDEGTGYVIFYRK